MKNILALLFGCWLTDGLAQTLPSGFPALEEAARRNQLLQTLDSTVSFSLRPLDAAVYADSSGTFRAGTSAISLWKEIAAFSNGAGSIRLLPMQLRADYNSTRPYGINNGAMIPAAGLQTLVSAGIFGKWGPLQVQLRPEWLYAANKEFDGFARPHQGVILARRYIYTWNYIDMPERFGEEPYQKLLPGQSHVTMNYKGFAAGYSTQNIWWGPGKYNSLLMSNHARGFKHLSLNTTRPAKTPVGHFEFQLLAGRLEASGYAPPDPDFTWNNNRVHLPKADDWRYLNGIMATYQPKWFRGLTVGGARVVQQYHKSAVERNDYLPVLTSLFRHEDAGFDDTIGRDHLLSVFARWVWADSMGEFYTEFGRNDASWNLRDFLLSPQHSRAYIVGMSKLLSLERKGSFLEANVEFTHLEKSGSTLLRAEPSWYVHGRTRHGYTHRGEVLGAGVGPGGNMQTVGLSWVQGINRAGVFFERIVNDNDFLYYAFLDSRDFRRYWIDIGFGLHADYRLGHFLLSGKLQGVRAFNYQWELTQLPGEPYFVNGRDLSNFYLSFNTAYLF